MARYARYNIIWCSLSVICGRSVVFSGYFGLLLPTKTDRDDIAEILLKVALNTITLTICWFFYFIMMWIGRFCLDEFCQFTYMTEVFHFIFLDQIHFLSGIKMFMLKIDMLHRYEFFLELQYPWWRWTCCIDRRFVWS